MTSPTDAGAICVADLGRKQRHRVVILSSSRFHRSTGRVLVAPELDTFEWEEPAPWHVVTAAGTFGLDHLRTLPQRRLLSVDAMASQGELRLALSLLRSMT